MQEPKFHVKVAQTNEGPKFITCYGYVEPAIPTFRQMPYRDIHNINIFSDAITGIYDQAMTMADRA